MFKGIIYSLQMNKLISWLVIIFRLPKHFLLLIRSFKTSNVVILTEHIGDIIAVSGLPEYLYKKNKKKTIWIINKKFNIILDKNPFITKIITVENLGHFIILEKILPKCIKNYKNYHNLHFEGRMCSVTKLSLGRNRGVETKINSENYYNYGSLVEVFTLIGGFGKIDLAPSLYLEIKKKSIQKYIVIHTSSNESVRNWNIYGWNAIIDNLINDKKIIVYELGFQKQYKNKSPLFIDFTGKKSLHEIASLIANSHFFIGIDSSFAHLANAYSVNSLILLGSYRNFKSYMPYSGYFKKNQSEFIYRHDGILSDLDPKPILSLIDKKL